MLQESFEKQMSEQRQWDAEMLRSQQQFQNQLMESFLQGLQVLQTSNNFGTSMSSSTFVNNSTSVPVPSNRYFQPINIRPPLASPVFSDSLLSPTVFSHSSSTPQLSPSIDCESPSLPHTSSPLQTTSTPSPSMSTKTSQFSLLSSHTKYDTNSPKNIKK